MDSLGAAPLDHNKESESTGSLMIMMIDYEWATAATNELGEKKQM